MDLENALEARRFVECAASQERSIGWVEPRGEKHGALAESVGGQVIFKLMLETKIVPSGVVAEQVAKRTEAIERETGRKPGKKEKKELQEDVRNQLLALAFTKKSTVLVWVDPLEKMLVVESGSQARTDEVLSELIKTFNGLVVASLQTVEAPAGAMARWLTTQELPPLFTADRDCVLKAQDESKSTVRYARHALDIIEIRGHIDSGKVPTQLALTWADRLSFVLTDSGTMRKLEFIDAAVKTRSKTSHGSSDFDADVAISTEQLRAFIPAFIEALGGEVGVFETHRERDEEAVAA